MKTIHDDPVTIVSIKFEFEFPADLTDAEVKMRAREMLLNRVMDHKIPNPYVTRLPPTYTIHCSACGTRMIISTENKAYEEEIKCPLMGCGKPTGYKGYMHVGGGTEENDPGTHATKAKVKK